MHVSKKVAAITSGGTLGRKGDGNRAKPARGAIQIALISSLAALLYCLLTTSPARAVTFMGGDCSFLTQANGYRLDLCKNLTKVTVDDIHLTISHTGLPNRTFDFGQASNCAALGNCFGPAVAPGANWNGIGGSTGTVANPLVWTGVEIASVNFRPGSVKIEGFWTKGGSPVPEPATWALLIVGFGLAGAALRSIRRRGVSGSALGRR